MSLCLVWWVRAQLTTADNAQKYIYIGWTHPLQLSCCHADPIITSHRGGNANLTVIQLFSTERFLKQPVSHSYWIIILLHDFLMTSSWAGGSSRGGTGAFSCLLPNRNYISYRPVPRLRSHLGWTEVWWGRGELAEEGVEVNEWGTELDNFWNVRFCCSIRFALGTAFWWTSFVVCGLCKFLVFAEVFRLRPYGYKCL